MKLSQILLGLGFSSLAMADISSKCDTKTAQFDDIDWPHGHMPSQFSVQCGTPVWWHIDLNHCFLNQNGLHYYEEGSAFKSYKITKDNQKEVLKLASEKLELNANGHPACFGTDSFMMH